MAASAKTREIAVQSLERFFVKHRVVYVWTFTSADVVPKHIAEERFKPFKDLISRRGKEMLFVWELQKRGAWHVHLVTDAFLDVHWLRPWMVARGWGPQMHVDRIQSSQPLWVEGTGWTWNGDRHKVEKAVRYLTKYLTKSLSAGRGGDIPDDVLMWARRESERLAAESPGQFEGEAREGLFNQVLAMFWGKKKVFGGSDSAKVGNTRFVWNPFITGKANSMLCSVGRAEWMRRFQSMCVGVTWLAHCKTWMKMGFDLLDYGSFDPFFEPP